jgi:hypothetical protein
MTLPPPLILTEKVKVKKDLAQNAQDDHKVLTSR